MKHFLLNASVKASLTKDRAVNTVRSTFNRDEEGDIVQTVLIIAAFVIIVVFVGTLLYNAIAAQASKTSNCIVNINTNTCTDFRR